MVRLRSSGQSTPQFLNEGNATILIEQDGEIIGMIALMDVPRKEKKKTLSELKGLGIKRMIMLTGDNQQVTEAVAKTNKNY